MSWTEKAISLFPDVLRPVNKLLAGRPLSYDDWNHFQYGFQGAKTIDYINRYIYNLRYGNSTTKARYRQQQWADQHFRYSERYHHSGRYGQSQFVFNRKSGPQRFKSHKTYGPNRYRRYKRRFSRVY